MKRSRGIMLVLSGTLAGGVFSGCDSSNESESDPSTEISGQTTYTNNHYVHGVGYYHAPYRAWYPFPYNHYDPQRGYYAGNRWSPTPETGRVGVSQPSPEAVSSARSRSSSSRSSSVRRSGFGSSSHSSSSSSS